MKLQSPFVLRKTHEDRIEGLQSVISDLRKSVTSLSGSSARYEEKYYEVKADLINLGHEKGRLEVINDSLESKVTSLQTYNRKAATDRAELQGTLMVKEDNIAQLVSKVARLQKYSSELVRAGTKLEADLAAALAPKTRKRKTAA